MGNVLGPAQLREIDPSSNSIVAHVNVGTMEGGGDNAGPNPCNLAASGQTVWAPLSGSGSSTTSGIWRVDAIHRRVSEIVQVGGNPCGVTLGHGKVWVANPSIDEVEEISPAGHLVRRIPLDSPPNAITAAPRHVWVVTR